MNAKKRDFDEDSATWDQEPRRAKLAKAVAQAIIETVRPNEGMDVLDFGCGTGLLTLELQPLVRSITGVDSSAGMLDGLKGKVASRNLANVKTQFLDLEQGAALAGSYDLIVSSMTLHHIREVGPLLVRLAGALRPGGRLCIADLAPDGGQFHTNNEGVFHFGFSESELWQGFAGAGLTGLTYRTAASVTKPAADGTDREFEIFLMAGRK